MSPLPKPSPLERTPAPIHRAGAPAEFLAFLPHLIGYRPERSVVVVPFADRRSLGALRFDLPAGDAVTAVDEFVGRLPVFGRADEVRIVLYVDELLHPAGTLPHASLADLVVARVRALGMRAGEAWCIGPDAWASYAEPGAARLDLEDLARAASALPDGLPELRSIDERAALPRVAAAEAAAVRAAVGALRDRHPSCELPGADVARVSALLRRVGRDPRAEPDPDAIARFLVQVQRLDRRREMQLDALWGGDRRSRDRMVRPSRERLDRVIAFAGHAAACAAETERPAAEAFLAICHWLDGQSSVAGVVIERALAADPHDSSLHALLRMLDSGVTANWMPPR